jgi:multiple sugar transport system substrate-binding protein
LAKEPKKNVSRRNFVKYAAGGAVAVVAAAAVGYYALQPTPSPPTPTTTAATTTAVVPTTTAPPPPPKKTHLDFVIWSWGVELVKDNVNNFQKQNPNTDITVTDISDAVYHDGVSARLIGNVPTDIFYNSDDWYREWAEAGWTVPAEDYMPVRNYESDIAPYGMQGVTHKGKMMGLPYYGDHMNFQYNELMLQEAGIDEPPKTWEELRDQALKIKQKGIVEYPIIYTLGGWWTIECTYALLYSHKDGAFFDKDFEPVMDQPGSAAEQVLVRINEEMNKYKITTKASLESSEADTNKAMMAKHHAFCINVKYNQAEINSATSPLHPHAKQALNPGRGGANGSMGWVRHYAVSKMMADRGKDAIDATWKLMEYFGGKTDGTYIVCKRLAVEKGVGFVYNSLYDDPDVRAAWGVWGDLDIMRKQAEQVRGKDGLTPYWGKFDPIFRKELTAAMLGQKPAHDALVTAAKEWRNLKAQYGG